MRAGHAISIKKGAVRNRTASTAAGTISVALIVLAGSLIQNVPATPIIPNSKNAPPEMAQAGNDLFSMKTQSNYSL